MNITTIQSNSNPKQNMKGVVSMKNTLTVFGLILAFTTGYFMGGSMSLEAYSLIAIWSLASIILKALSLVLSWIKENKEATAKVEKLMKNHEIGMLEFTLEQDRKKREASPLYFNQVPTKRAATFEERLLARKIQKMAHAA